jgi:hypothetical protein
MKKLFAALLFVCAAIALHGQSIYVPAGINYGGGLVIKETQGTGAPSPSCSGFIRYWQTDAATSPMWECLGGSMVNIGTGSGGGGSSFAVTTTATGLQALTGAFQAPNIFVGSSDTNIFRCGTTCLGLGSVAGTVNGSFKALNITGNDNGVINPTLSAGADIGAKVNTAFAALATGGTVRIPAGSYSFSTTINYPGAGYHLDCDAGTVLTYTGSTTAINFFDTRGQPTDTEVTGIDGHGGCLLQGTSRTGSGILINPSNMTYVTGMRIENFAMGINDAGGNGVEIFNNKFLNNHLAVHTITVTNFAPNAVHTHDNEFAGNDWGYYSENGHVTASHALGNVIRDNSFEGEATGDIYLAWDARALVDSNYFESCGVGVQVGAADNVFNITITHNYFSPSACERSEIELGNGFDFRVSDNYEQGTDILAHTDSSGCKVNVFGSEQGAIGVNAFNLNAEGTINTPNNVCISGAATNDLGGQMNVHTSLRVGGILTVDKPGFHLGPDTQNNGSTPVGYIGGIGLYMARFDPAGSCGPPPLMWLTPDGLSICQGTTPTATTGVWTKK